jgi:hypothetical protein
MSNLRRFLFRWGMLPLLSTSVFAQGTNLPACSFLEVKYLTLAAGTPALRVNFNVGPQTGKGPVDWKVIDVTGDSIFHISASQDRQDNTDLWLPTLLDSGHSYFLTASGLPGCDPSKPPVMSVAFDNPPPAVPPKVPFPHDANAPPANSGHRFTLSPSKARTDSDLYLSGLVSGATGQKASYTADIKAQFNYILKQADEKNPEVAILPSFDFTSSNNPKQDGNSVMIGTAFRLAWANKVPPLSAFGLYTILEPGFAIQADPRFRVVEPLFRLPVYAVPHVLQFGPFVAYLQPTFGIETGGSTKMPSAGDYASAPSALPKTGGIVRPFAGGSLFVNINQKVPKGAGESKSIFSLETDYINRWPLIAEPTFSQTSAGTLTLMGIGRQPRGYVTTKIERDFNSYLSIALEDDYGELPPLYTKVDNKYSLTLTYKAALKVGAGAK